MFCLALADKSIIVLHLCRSAGLESTSCSGYDFFDTAYNNDSEGLTEQYTDSKIGGNDIALIGRTLNPSILLNASYPIQNITDDYSFIEEIQKVPN